MTSPASGRLISDHRLTPDDFYGIARERGITPSRARKIGLVVGRRVSDQQRVDTLWNGKETSNVAEPGDWVVTSLGSDRRPMRDRDGNANVYVITAGRFDELYQAEGGPIAEGWIFRPKAIVEAISLPQGFDIVAPWGERQTGDKGYLIRNGDDVYGNNADTFEASYEIV